MAVGGAVIPRGVRTLKAEHAAGGRPYLEFKKGADLHRATNTWSELLRVLDRADDRYVERIIAEDGSVIRDVDEPLSEHRGRGADLSAPKSHP